MRRKLPALAVLLAFVCALTAGSGAALASGTCSDSWGADGHSGPWYSSGSTLHGNTLVITCPSSTTAWSVHYLVVKETVCCSVLGSPIDITRSGHGNDSFSVSTSPVGCNPGWNYYTHVHNIITGGDIWKPTEGYVHTIC